jgi:Protein of unknown function (DUF998)
MAESAEPDTVTTAARTPIQVQVLGPRRILLAAGLVAAPLYILLVVLQMLTRDGFDISRHPPSVLSNGDQGWIQISNVLATGLLFIASAVGLRRVLPSAANRGAVGGPRLVGVFGAAMVAAGIFSADPVDGFPRERQPGRPPASVGTGSSTSSSG